MVKGVGLKLFNLPRTPPNLRRGEREEDIQEIILKI